MLNVTGSGLTADSTENGQETIDFPHSINNNADKFAETRRGVMIVLLEREEEHFCLNNIVVTNQNGVTRRSFKGKQITDFSSAL